jgi:hypothetical protein
MVDGFALAQGRTASRWFLGWAKARLHEPREGHALIREAYEENVRLGMLSGGSETLGYAAEALVLGGDLEGAQKELDQALQISSKYGERVYLPQLLLIEATIARGKETPAMPPILFGARSRKPRHREPPGSNCMR